jgi:hypothetical protein
VIERESEREGESHWKGGKRKRENVAHNEEGRHKKRRGERE